MWQFSKSITKGGCKNCTRYKHKLWDHSYFLQLVFIPTYMDVIRNFSGVG